MVGYIFHIRVCKYVFIALPASTPIKVTIEPNQAMFNRDGISLHKAQNTVIAMSQTENITNEIPLSKLISFLPRPKPPANHSISPIAKQTR